MDVNNNSSVKQGIKHIVTKEGHLNVVINNASFGIAGTLEDTSIEDARFQFETNFFGVLRVCHEVLPIMRKAKHGNIINIGSITGSIGAPFNGAYSASKSELQRFTEVLRMEIKPSGIHALLIEPGDFNTGITDRRIYTKQSQTTLEYKERCNRAVQN